MADELKILVPDDKGLYAVDNKRADIQRVDISDVDLVITFKNGDRYLIPDGGIKATSDTPPTIMFADGALSASELLSEVGAVMDLATAVNVPTSMKQDGQKAGGVHEQELADKVHKLQKQVKHLKKEITEAKKHQQDDNQHHKSDQDAVSSITTDTVQSVEQMVAQAQQTVDALHDKDFDYVPPEKYTQPPAPPSTPPGLPPPISLSPIVTLFMGNVVETTSDTTSNPGYTTFYGGGGAVGSDAASQIGPRNALQFSAATIDATGVSGNVIIYAEGPQVGNTNPAAQNFAYYAKELILNVAGYFTTLNSIQVSGVPTGVTLLGTGITNTGGGNWTIPSNFVSNQLPFDIVYSTSGTGSFSIQITVTGTSIHGEAFTSVQNVEFEYMDVTNASQVTNPYLVYGYGQEIYILPTQAQPNIITAGDGNDIVYGGPNTDMITLGNGNNTVTDYNGIGDSTTVGNGNNTITLGNGTGDSVTAGNGTNSITVSGPDITIVAGSGSNTITTAGGGGSISAGAGGAGTNSVTINSTSGSTDVYTISLLGTGTNTITAGDDNYNITLGNATNSVTIGNGTSTGNGVTTFDTTIAAGNGNNTIVTGSGTHEITIGAAVSASSITTGAGNNTFVVNSAANSTATYTITATHGGNTIINTTNGGVGGTQGDGDYQIDLGAGNSSITLGNSTDTGNGVSTFDTTITTGAGTSTITAGSGTHDITVGAGLTAITVGSDNNTITATSGGGGTIAAIGVGSEVINTGTGGYTITTSGGGGTFTTGSGGSTNNDTININAASGRTSDVYAITMSSTGTNTIATAASDDGEYTINVGNDTATTISIGNSTATHSGMGTTAANYDTQITLGTGNNTISTGVGEHYISVGAGTTSITVSASDTANNYITSASGGGTVTSNGSGVNTVTTGAGNYTINTTGAGNNVITVSGNGTNTITVGNGANSINGASATGSNSATVGSGVNTVTLGTSGNSIAGSTDSVTISNGSAVTPTATGSTSVYTLYGAANNTVQLASGATGNGNYNITMGNVTGTNSVTLGNGYSQAIASSSLYTAYDTWILAGTGNSNINVGTGDHYISVGAGTTSITVSASDTASNYITSTSGGGTITSNGSGVNTILTGTGTYTVNATGSGNNVLNDSGSDTATLGGGNNTVTISGSGTSNITVGNGTNAINGASATGSNSITVGSGLDTVTLGTSGNSIAGSTDSVTISNGSTVTPTATGSTLVYSLYGAANNTVQVAAGATGNGNYNITMGNVTGTNSVTLGNGYSQAIASSSLYTAYDTWILAGTGNSNINVGTGDHYISVGAGTTSITVSASDTASNYITSTSGGGSITTNGSGVNTILTGTGTYTVNATGNNNNTLTDTGSSDTATLGNGNNTVTLSGAGNNNITVGNGNNTISGANAIGGNNTVTVGSGVNNVTLGTSGQGGGTTNKVIINNGSTAVPTAPGSTSVYTFYTTPNNIVQIAAGSTGNGNYNITMGNATDTVTLGSGYSQAIASTSAYTAYDTWIMTGTGTSNITVGAGDHYISTGAGTSNITDNGTDTGSNYIALAGGTGGTINMSDNGANTIKATASGSYTINETGSGNQTVTMAGGGGTISTGSGVNTITVTSGNYTITTGNGHGDSVTAGSGNNTINMGTGGADTISLGSGNSTVNIGLGTANTITGGAGTNTLSFSALTTGLTLTFGTVTAGSGSASATGASDTFTGFSGTTDVTGTNHGDTITVGSGTFNITDGSGAAITDTITLGSGTDALTVNNTTATSINNITLGTGVDTVHAGNGTNTITGTGITTAIADLLYGGTGNNTYLNPDAGTTYNGTNSAALTAIANNPAYTFTNTTGANPFASATGIPSYLVHTYSGGVETVTLDLNTQLNLINYSANGSTALTINLSTGAGTGGTAQGAIYAFTPTSGYSTIDGIIGDNGGDTFTPSFSNTILIGGSGANTFNDGGTISTQTVELVGNNTASGSGTDTYNMGAASEIIVASTHNGNNVYYSNSPSAIVVNFDSVAHTFSSTAFASSITVNAYSGTNWGTDLSGSANSWSTGDYFVPVAGTATDIGYLVGAAQGDIVYGGSYYLSYQDNGGDNYFYAGSGGSTYYANNYGSASTPSAAVALNGGTNVFDTNTGTNMFVILNKTYDTGTQHTVDTAFSTTYGGTAYTGFSYGLGQTINQTPTGYFDTYISGYENIVGGAGNDYFVGDANNDQFNAEGGANTIILGGGNNIIDVTQGNNTVSLTTASGVTTGTNTLNLETSNDAYSGVIASYSSALTSGVDVFLNNTSETSFFGSNDQQIIWGTNYAAGKQVLTGNGVSGVQSGIISLINGSDYSNSSDGSDVSTSNTFYYDNVYSGAATIRAHSGNNVFLDNQGSGSETFVAGTGANIYYLTPSQVTSSVTISGTTTVSGDNILRVEGWGDSGTGFGTDPFTSTGSAKNISGINVVDVRSGQDTVTIGTTTDTITLGAGSTSHTATYNLSAADVQYLNGNGTSSQITLMLDSGETFTPTAGQHYYGEGSAAIGASGSNWVYYIGYSSTPTSYGQAGYTAIIDVHYGTGAFSSSGVSATNHASA